MTLELASIAVGVASVAALVLGVLNVRLRRRLSLCSRALEDAERKRGDVADAVERLGRVAPAFYIDLPAATRGGASGPALPGMSAMARRLLGLDASAEGRPALLGAFDADNAARLEAALDRLNDDGTPFRLRLKRAETDIDVIGHRSDALGGSVVWLWDASADAAALRRVERKRDRARSQRDRLNDLIQALPWPVWQRNRDLDICFANAAFLSAVGLDADLFADAEHLEDPQTAPRLGTVEFASKILTTQARAFARSAAAKGAAAAERRHLVVGGERRAFSVTEIPAADGTPMTGTAVDVTALEEVQNDLQRHIAAYSEIFENLASGIAIFASDARLTFFNSAYARMWQLDEGWLDTHPTENEILEHLHAKRRLPEVADFPAFKRERRERYTTLLSPEEEMLHRPDGRTLRAIVAPHPLGGLLHIYEDVTDRLALERSYNTLIAVQRATIDNLSEGIAVFGSDGRLRLGNPIFARLWRLKPEELEASIHVSEFSERCLPLFESDAQWEQFRTMLLDQLSERHPSFVRLDLKNGNVYTMTGVPLPDGASLIAVLDVTDSARVERALRDRAEAFADADRLKSEFIANVSYELRTPLNTIIGFAELLNEHYHGVLNERQREYANAILHSSEHLMVLINDILDLASVEAGHMSLEIDTVDIHDLLSSVLDLARERMRRQEVEVELDCPADIGWFIADGRRMKQVMFNLLSNALKFTPPHGKVTLSARKQEGQVTLTVADTGAGIPPEELSRVFDKFYRGRTRGSGRAAGPGLGLPLVKSFIELHGGHIDIESAPDKGTRVICTLPAEPGMRTVAADAREASKPDLQPSNGG